MVGTGGQADNGGLGQVVQVKKSPRSYRYLGGRIDLDDVNIGRHVGSATIEANSHGSQITGRERDVDIRNVTVCYRHVPRLIGGRCVSDAGTGIGSNFTILWGPDVYPVVLLSAARPSHCYCVVAAAVSIAMTCIAGEVTIGMHFDCPDWHIGLGLSPNRDRARDSHIDGPCLRGKIDVGHIFRGHRDARLLVQVTVTRHIGADIPGPLSNVQDVVPGAVGHGVSMARAIGPVGPDRDIGNNIRPVGHLAGDGPRGFPEPDYELALLHAANVDLGFPTHASDLEGGLNRGRHTGQEGSGIVHPIWQTEGEGTVLRTGSMGAEQSRWRVGVDFGIGDIDTGATLDASADRQSSADGEGDSSVVCRAA